MRHKTVGIAICIVLITNVSAVLGVPQEKANTNGKTESFVYVNLFDQESKQYIMIENETPCGNCLVMEPNLVTNPSFEDGDTMPTGWTYPPDTNGIYQWDSNYSYEGAKSVGVLNLTSSDQDLYWITTDFIPVDYTVNTYLFSVWFKLLKTPWVHQFTHFYIHSFDENYTYLGKGGFGVWNFNPEWQRQRIITTTYNEIIKYVKLEIGQDGEEGFEPDPSVEVRFDDIYFGVWNTLPDTPTITGETTGTVRTVYDYTFSTIDPNQDNVSYKIDWGDNTTTTTAIYESGEEIIIPHIWGFEGTYIISAKAIDEHDAESDWVNLTITMPYSSNISFQPFWEKFFERFPHAFSILRHLIGYSHHQ